jgi:DNA polymerase
MSESDQSPEQLSVIIRQLIDSLRAAGVEWLPQAADLPVPTRRVEPVADTATPGRVVSLFESTDTLPAETATLTVEERLKELTVLRERVTECTRCEQLAKTRRQTVFGVGKIDPELCFVGEAPGADEDRQGEPFVGAAGQLLNRIIAAMGMKREEVFILNILKCRPPGNRLPLPNEAANCREYLDRQLALVQPKFICCLGACAAQNLLGTSTSISRLRGRFHDYRGIPVLCTFHPAFLLRNPERKRDVWEDMKKLLEKMGRPIGG